MSKTDWTNIGFGYSKTDCNIRCYHRNGKWGELEIHESEEISMHMVATCLHYGQQAFEGLKAFRGEDGKVRIFRLHENAKRLQLSAQGIRMAPVPIELFEEAIIKVVKLNERFVPPYGSGASLYIRPFLAGTGPQIGVLPAEEFLFAVFVMPVGAYNKEGFDPADLVIYRQYDRAAPQGTGRFKVGGNYAASMVAQNRAKGEGYAAVLYLDAKEKKYLDECGPANFFGIKENTYVTPKSDSILQSITNMSLRQIAKDFGLAVEQRKIEVEELSTFEEVGECGTAAVISPIKRIYDNDMDKEYCFGTEAGPISLKLYEQLQGIQYGTKEDKHNWMTEVELPIGVE